jgi:pimeloyl-ACP methyl ester carboxylesterase
MVSERDLQLDDGRTLRVHDTGADAAASFTLIWHHGSPQTGALLEPLVSAAAERAIRLLSYGRPGYGGSSLRPGRDVASAAADVARIADAFGIDRFAVMGASGGGSHALACAALLPNRVTGAVCLGGIAPLTDDFDWFGGMVSDGACGLQWRGAKHAHGMQRPPSSIPTASPRLTGRRCRAAGSSLGSDAVRASDAGTDGAIDDDVAYVSPWGST